MSTLDGIDLFGSGPHSIRPLAWLRDLRRRGLGAGDGELLLDMGLRSRQIAQTGRLQAPTAAAMAALVAAVQTRCDGQLHELVDNHGQAFPSVLLEKFEQATPIQNGRTFWCDYTLTYRQLP